jgi:hypothetical protein
MAKGSVEDLIRELSNLRLEFHARQEEILADLAQAALQETEAVPDYQVGDRVRITTTRSSRPQGAAATERDYTATVTRVTESRIYIRTDNNFYTWRARTNVTLIARRNGL